MLLLFDGMLDGIITNRLANVKARKAPEALQQRFDRAFRPGIISSTFLRRSKTLTGTSKRPPQCQKEQVTGCEPASLTSAENPPGVNASNHGAEYGVPGCSVSSF